MPCLTELVLSLRAVFFLPNDFVMRKGEIGHNLYFINKGTVNVIQEEDSKILATLHEGSFFGEAALLSDEPRNASIRTNDFCELFTLDKHKFQDVLRKFPDFAHEIELERIARDKSARKLVSIQIHLNYFYFGNKLPNFSAFLMC
jgi:CRP-like cAMP-binding protein